MSDSVKQLSDALASGSGWTVLVIVGSGLFAKWRDIGNLFEYMSGRRTKKIQEALKEGGLTPCAESLLKDELNRRVVSAHIGIKGNRLYREAVLRAVESGKLAAAELARVRAYLKEENGALKVEINDFDDRMRFMNVILAIVLPIGAMVIFLLAWSPTQGQQVRNSFFALSLISLMVAFMNGRQAWLIVEAKRVGKLLESPTDSCYDPI